MTSCLTGVELADLPVYRRGKVRDLFDLGDQLLIVATDRLSAFDVVLPTLFPGKGLILNRLAVRWFEWTGALMPNHLISTDLAPLPLTPAERSELEGRSMVVRKAERIGVECVVRGFLAGSAWREYQAAGSIHGERAPTGLRQGDELPSPRFTPAIKVDTGHDENVSRAEIKRQVGPALADELETRSLRLYIAAAAAARRAGFVLADTKFEFGHADGELVVIDEMFTPDSSRYWELARYRPGMEPPSFDKQVVRNWLDQSGWDKQPPGPTVPASVVDDTLYRYRTVEARVSAVLSGGAFNGAA